MRLISVEIQNFRVFRHASLMLPDQVIGIIGPNGSGKSSLVEAITWALYGNQVARSSKEEIRAQLAAPTDPCAVALDFEIRGQTYRVIRRLVGKSERAESEIWKDGVRQSIGSTESVTFIANLLRLDWRGFLSSFLARQQELNTLSDLQPARRREFLAGMLGVERLDEAMRQVREDSRLLAQKSDLLRRQVDGKADLDHKIADLQEHVTALRSERDRSAGALNEAQANLEHLVVLYGEHDKRRSDATRLAAQFSALNQTSLIVEEQATRLTTELANLEQGQSRFADLITQLADYDRIRLQLEQLRDAQARQERRADFENQLRLARTELDEHTSKSVSVRKTLADAHTALASLPVDIAARLAETDRQLDDARHHFAGIQAKSDSARRDLAKVDKQIADISSFGKGTTCDRCHRPFGDELPKIKAHLTAEADDIRRTIADLDRQVADAQSAGKVLRQTSDRLKAEQLKRAELEVQTGYANRELVEIERRIGSATLRIDQAQTVLAQLGEVSFDPAELERVNERYRHLEGLRVLRDQLAGSLSRLPTVRTELTETQTRLAKLRQDMTDIESQRQSVGFDEAAFARVAEDYARASGATDEARDQLTRATSDLEATERELAVYLKQAADLAAGVRELESATTDQFYTEKLGALFGDFRKALIARIRPRLSELASALIADMTSGKYSLIDLDENYDLRVLSGGQFYGIERFSGGEKDLANLCLRLAISQALTESAGLDRSFVILDEVFGSQDEERKELIIDGLGRLKQFFPQVLLITHIEGIKDRVETLIEVAPTPSGWSEVRVVGQAQ